MLRDVTSHQFGSSHVKPCHTMSYRKEGTEPNQVLLSVNHPPPPLSADAGAAPPPRAL